MRDVFGVCGVKFLCCSIPFVFLYANDGGGPAEVEMPLLENRAGCFLFRGGEVGEASVEYDVGDLTEFGEVKVVGVVGTADGGLA